MGGIREMKGERGMEDWGIVFEGKGETRKWRIGKV